MRVSLQVGGVVAARIAIGFGGEEKSSLFPLHAFIPLLKCSGLYVDARRSYPSTIFLLSLDRFFHVFHLVLAGLFLSLFLTRFYRLPMKSMMAPYKLLAKIILTNLWLIARHIELT